MLTHVRWWENWKIYNFKSSITKVKYKNPIGHSVINLMDGRFLWNFFANTILLLTFYN